MYFFSQTFLNVTANTGLVGSWNVAGYERINVHAWVRGGSGSVGMLFYFNNLQAYAETLTIGPVGPGGWNIASFTRTYSVHAPTLSIVLNNPTTNMDFDLRLYAACCAPSGFFAKLFPAKQVIEGDAERKLNLPVDIEALALRSPQAAAASRPKAHTAARRRPAN
jgi:hypothetical protein